VSKKLKKDVGNCWMQREKRKENKDCNSLKKKRKREELKEKRDKKKGKNIEKLNN
jgi:predicted nucleic acid binding AN1-type Zn finger protein